ncbi:MAG: MBL fold metallo-hydrolase [Acidobacteria bacterium]|jgi:glyoxylase-like metal-dependent hydrolase (beta-lactamase superfamily II)|nr:MAG: MBL fold metallo-hydrolase [Acidobacteriota bacterium]
MRRLYLLPLTLFALVLVVWTAGVDAVQEPHPSIEVHRITDTLYMLGSGMETGGNIAVLIAESGVVLVDTKLEGYGPDILDHLRRLTDKPVTMIINTHVHYDHSGANTEFPDTVQFVAHENIRRHWARTDCQPIPTNCDDFQGENRKYLPKTTFSDRLSLFAGTPDQIDLYYFGRGHTDGDTFVVFKEARAMHVGDMFLGKTLPFIDAENGNGGSAIEFGRTLTKVIDSVPNVDTIINGHWNTLLTWDDLVDYRGFYTDLYTQTRRSLDAGLSAEEAVAAYEKPARYSEYSANKGGAGFTVDAIVNYIYRGI